MLRITAGEFGFSARLEEAAPSTVSVLKGLLPLRSKLVQAR